MREEIKIKHNLWCLAGANKLEDLNKIHNVNWEDLRAFPVKRRFERFCTWRAPSHLMYYVYLGN
jgi:hypothetical protein